MNTNRVDGPSYGLARMRKKKPRTITLSREEQILQKQEALRATAREMIKNVREMYNRASDMRKMPSAAKKRI
jgi:hypothetical protein